MDWFPPHLKLHRGYQLLLAVFFTVFACLLQSKLVNETIPELLLLAPLAWCTLIGMLMGPMSAISVAIGISAFCFFEGQSQANWLFALVQGVVPSFLAGCWVRNKRPYRFGLPHTWDIVVVLMAVFLSACVRGFLTELMWVSQQRQEVALVAFRVFALEWFAGVLFIPTILVWSMRPKWTRTAMLEFTLLAIGTILVTQLLFGRYFSQTFEYPLVIVTAYLVIFGWVSIRFFTAGLTALGLITFAVIFSNILGMPPIPIVPDLSVNPTLQLVILTILGLLLAVQLMMAANSWDRLYESTGNAQLHEELRVQHQKLAEQALVLAEEQAFHDAILAQLPAGIIVVDREGRILKRNQRHKELWNESGEDSLDIRDLEEVDITITKQHRLPVDHWPLAQALNNGVSTEGLEATIVNPKKPKKASIVSLSTAPVLNFNDEVIGAVSIMTDITERRKNLQILREQEERLRFAMQTARMIAIEWDLKTDELRASQDLATWLNLKQVNPIDTMAQFIKWIQPRNLAEFQEAINLARNGGNEFECEISIKNSDGQQLWVLIRGQRTKNAEGRYLSKLGCVFVDITDQHRNAERLRLLESAVVHARDAVIILEANHRPGRGRCVLYANDAFCEMTGYSTSELLGKSLHFLRGKKSSADTLLQLRHALDSGQSFKGELLNYRKDGSPIWVEISLVPVPGPHGQHSHWVMIQRDISDRKSSEVKLRSSEELLAESQRIARLGSWEERLDQQELVWSEEHFRIYGRDPNTPTPTPEEMLQQILHEDRKRFHDFRLQLIGTTGPQSIKFRILTPQQQVRHLYVLCQVVYCEHGNPVCIRGITQDITEQSVAQEQLIQSEKMSLIGQMAGGIAHDFNNIITGILLSLKGIELPQDDPNWKYIQTVSAASERAADLTRKLLGFARKQQLHIEPVHVTEFVNETLSIVRRTFDPRIEITANVHDDLGVEADVTLMAQVILNLMINAKDAMPNGGKLSVSAKVVCFEQAPGHHEGRIGEFVCIQVQDTGHGMPQDVQQRLFEPFFTTKPIGQGTGLGLAMAHGIMLSHQGWIECQSELGVGTRFNLYLPKAKGAIGRSGILRPNMLTEVQPDTASVEQTPMPRIELEVRCILLVDDEDMIRTLGRAVLENNGYEVFEAEDGEHAVELFQLHHAKIDLVILDLTMPRMSGQDTFRHMQAIRQDVRVLFSSGYSAEDLSNMHGALGLLPKPYRPHELLEVVKQVSYWETPQAPTERDQLAELPTA